MGRLDEPALAPADRGAGPVTPSSARPLVRFRDGTWQECRVAEWQPDGDGRWLCHLAWGVSGTVMHGWYVYDPAGVRPG